MSGIKGRSAPSGPRALTKASSTITFGTSVATKAIMRVTGALSGLRVTDRVVVNPRAGVAANLGIVGARVNAADVIEVWVVNPTVADINAGASLVVDVVIQRFTGA